jgi:hypothetical protein
MEIPQAVLVHWEVLGVAVDLVKQVELRLVALGHLHRGLLVETQRSLALVVAVELEVWA